MTDTPAAPHPRRLEGSPCTPAKALLPLGRRHQAVEKSETLAPDATDAQSPGGNRVRPLGQQRQLCHNNKRLGAGRDDLAGTTDVLDEDVEVIGDVSAEIWFRSSLPYTDAFVRPCDVDAEGRSANVYDGLTSLTCVDRPTLAPSNCGRRPTVSVAVTASARRSPAAPSPASAATLARENPTRRRPDRGRPSSRSCTIPTLPRPSSCP